MLRRPSACLMLAIQVSLTGCASSRSLLGERVGPSESELYAVSDWAA